MGCCQLHLRGASGDFSCTDALASGEEFNKRNSKHFSLQNVDHSDTRVMLERADNAK